VEIGAARAKSRLRALYGWEPLHMISSFRRFLHEEKGATAIEYGLIASLIAVVIIGAVTAVGNGLTNTFNEVSGNLH
jgi:pilus assembly protein Flp/PilA